MPAYLPEGNFPLSTDTAERSLQKIVSLLYGQSPLNTKLASIWVPARAMMAATTNGAASGSVETATNKLMLASYDFDTTTQEYVQFHLELPKSAAYSQAVAVPGVSTKLTAQFAWTCASGVGASSKTVQWGWQGVGMVDGDDIDEAWGTAKTVSDTWQADMAMHVTAETDGIDISNGGSYPCFNFLRVYRDVAADDLNGDALLLGMMVRFYEVANTDA